MKVFEGYARCYDALYRDKDYKGEARFVFKLLKKHKARFGSLADLGCGTGAYTDLLAVHFKTALGVDMSSRMLDEAKKRQARSAQPKKTRFVLGDARSFRTTQKFDVVASLFHVLSYQTKNEDFLRTFATASSLTAKGGLFICDFWHGPGVITEPPEYRIKEIDGPHAKIIRTATPTLFCGENAVLVHYDINYFDKIQGTKRKFAENHKMRYFFKPEIDLACWRSGFASLEFGEWMTGKTPGFKTWNAYLVARKES